MAAYILAFIDVTDTEAYERYKQLAPGAIAEAGGKYLVRGGAVDVLEGKHDGRRVVVLEFPSTEAAKAFYDGERYRYARAARANAAKGDFLLVPGI